MKKRYNIKKTISVKQFIEEFGENFSDHMKKRLLEIEVRCVLVRTEELFKLDLKHVEHNEYPTLKDSNKTKEYAFAQFIVIDEILYFSEKCTENDKLMQCPVVSSIYNSLSNEDMTCFGDVNIKKIDDSNIDYVIDNIMEVCPEVSQSYVDIVKDLMTLTSR